MPPYRELYRPPSSRASSRPRVVYTRPASPDLEEFGFSTDLGDPAEEPGTWSPTGWLANKASAAADYLKRAGQDIMDHVREDAFDLAGTLYAAATGKPPEDPGKIFNFASEIAESVFGHFPTYLQEKLTINNESNIAGYITLADGRRIPVPKAEDTQGQGEKALSDNLKAALTKANADRAAAISRERIESQKLAIDKDQFDRNFALKERAAAQASEINDIAIKAAQLAYDRQRYSSAQLALWGIASTAEPAKEKPQRVIRAIGPGLAGAPVQIGLGPAWGRMVGD